MFFEKASNQKALIRDG